MFVLLLILYLLFATPAIAGDPPNLFSPEDNSSVSSSTLNWQTPNYPLYSSNPYRIQVDDESNFSSPNKDYYTKNNYYTPILSWGNWFWRLKAKDSSGSWSDWSSIWFFTLVESISSPMPSSDPTPTPTPVQSSTPTPTQAPLPSPTPKKTSPTVKTSPTSIPSPTPKSLPSTPSTEINTPKPKSLSKITYRVIPVVNVAQSATPSAVVEVKSQKQSNIFSILGVIFIICGISSLTFIYLRHNEKVKKFIRR